MMTTNNPTLLSAYAAAQYLGICPETLRHRVQDGTLVPSGTGDAQRFDKAALDIVLDKSKLLQRNEVLDFMGIRSDRLSRLVRLGQLPEVMHTIYGRCFDRETVATLRGPQPWSELMSSREVAAALHVTSSTLRRWRQEGRVTPVHTTPAGDHLYSKATVEDMRVLAKDDLVRGHEAAALLDVSLDGLYNLDKTGKLAGIVVRTPGGRRRYYRKALLEYNERRLDVSHSA